MKYSISNYARALVEVLESAEVLEHAELGVAKGGGAKASRRAAAAKNFLALVRRNGDEGRFKKILDEAWRLTLRRGGAREVVIESARPLGALQKKVVHAFVKSRDVVREKINPDLVAGVKVTVNGETQFDGTMKAKLDKLFA